MLLPGICACQLDIPLLRLPIWAFLLPAARRLSAHPGWAFWAGGRTGSGGGEGSASAPARDLLNWQSSVSLSRITCSGSTYAPSSMVPASQLLSMAEEKQTAMLTGLTFSLSEQISRAHSALSRSPKLSPGLLFSPLPDDSSPTLLLSPRTCNALLLLTTLS